MKPRALIAQISDLHIKAPGLLAYGSVDTAAALMHCVEALNRFAPRPDLVVISGDLVDVPSREAYDHLARLLAPLEIAFAAVPGNHDDRRLMRAIIRQDDGRAPETGPVNLVRAAGDVDLLLLDSTVPGSDYGELSNDSLYWLDAALAASSTRPALLFLHHPPFATGIAHMDVQNLRNAASLAAVLRKHERVRLVAAGHVHRAVVTNFSGVTATICPAPNHAVALDLDACMRPSFNLEPPAFHLHVWSPSDGFGNLVTHWVPIGAVAGPHPFFDDGGRLL